jgi:hypothetical protein
MVEVAAYGSAASVGHLTVSVEQRAQWAIGG